MYRYVADIRREVIFVGTTFNCSIKNRWFKYLLTCTNDRDTRVWAAGAGSRSYSWARASAEEIGTYKESHQ
jgi:hypothetical protein